MKWEYKVVYLLDGLEETLLEMSAFQLGSFLGEGKKTHNPMAKITGVMAERLNELGKDGWELVAVNEQGVAFFKKQVTKP